MYPPVSEQISDIISSVATISNGCGTRISITETPAQIFCGSDIKRAWGAAVCVSVRGAGLPPLKRYKHICIEVSPSVGQGTD